MRAKWIVLIGVITSMPLFAAQKTQDKIPVFVRSEAAVGGFTDPSKDRQDSINDLVKKIKSADSVRTVEAEKDALVVLEVLNRETKREANGWTAVSGSKQNKSFLTVRLIAGEYTAEFAGKSGSKGLLTGYGAAAGDVVKQLETWVRANRAQLLAIKK